MTKVVGLDFAWALQERPSPAHDKGILFVASNTSLPAFGPSWALELQNAVKEWHSGSNIVVPAQLAAGFAVRAMEKGLRQVYCPPDHPALQELELYAQLYRARVVLSLPLVQETWSARVPVRKSAKRARNS